MRIYRNVYIEMRIYRNVYIEMRIYRNVYIEMRIYTHDTHTYTNHCITCDHV